MLVSGGQILAIDKVNTGNTISGDGVLLPLEVNTELIATTSSVSSVSSILNQNITNVSSTLNQEITNVSSVLNQNITNVSADLENYYTKDETTTVINDALEGVIKHETEVSAQDIAGNIIAVTRTVKEDGTVVFELSAKPEVSDTNIIGINGISAEQREDLAWVISYTGKSGNIYSAATPNLNIYEDANHQWWISAAEYPDVSKFLTSAEGHADEALVLKNNQWVPADDVFATDDDIRNLSATVASTYLSASEFDTYSADVNNKLTALESTAEHYTTNSAKYYSTYQTVYDNSAAWNAHSALSATKLDASESAKFMKIADLQSAPDNTISGYGESAFYYPPLPEIPEYSGKDGIKVENYEISISADYLSASDKYLSANALDELSGKWEDTANTVSTASGGWNEASAFGANSGKFVTSAGVPFEEGKAYVLAKDEEENVTWSGVDLSDLGKMYPITSLTPDLVSATISAVDGVSAYVLSAAAPEQVATPDISGYGLSAWKDAEENKYFVSANIIGNHGVSAAYDTEANTWNLGISANDYAFLFGNYTNAVTITDGTRLKLESNNKHLINVDEQGYITLPETTNKFTFCINEYVDNNTTENHEYLLNKLVLSAKDNDAIVTSQNFYPSEVGSSNVTIAITIDNTAAAERQYCIVYKGSDVDEGKLHIDASILEEVTSLDSTGGAIEDYTGTPPIYVNDNTRHIKLEYDTNVFKLVEDELGVKKLTIDAGSETIDAKKFEKMAELIDTRMTETFPIGLVCDEGTIGANTCVSYMFRPNMTYDCTSATSAYIYNGTVDDNQVYARIGIYEIEDNNAALVWKSALTLLKKNSQNTFSAASDTITGTISTDKLYYACILTNNKQINDILGINGNGTADVGNPKPWCTVNNIDGNGKPFSNTDFSASVAFADFGSFTGTIKPYIGLRGSI